MSNPGQWTRQDVLIGGRWVPAANGTYSIVDPSTEEAVGEAPDASAEQVYEACRAARNAFEHGEWPTLSGVERGQCLAAAADRLERRAPELVELAIAETGSTRAHSELAQVGVAIDRLRMYAELARESTAIAMHPLEREPIAGSSANLASGVTTLEPVGVVACICPSNTPVTNCAGKVGPALAMGNTVVLKPPVQDPLGMAEFAQELSECFPPGVINYVNGRSPELGEALVLSRDVDMISFTGSTHVGQRIAEVGGRTMKRLLLELGGKSASIVFGDCDVENAIRNCATTWTFHSGQMCVAPTRLLIERGFFDEFVHRMVEFGNSLPVGSAHDPATIVGPMISQPHMNHVVEIVERSLAEGANIACGGRRHPGSGKGYLYEPTLLTNVRNDMEIAQQEVFGPVIAAIPFDDDEEAIRIANDSEFGLYGYVWSGDTARGVRIAQGMRTGTIQVNGAPPNPWAPFGGFKQSGLGRDGGRFGLSAYSEPKYVGWAC